jgi:hypothetical protein
MNKSNLLFVFLRPSLIEFFFKNHTNEKAIYTFICPFNIY